MPTADQDIVDLNLVWLVKARELARSNRTKAAVMLGLDASLVDEFSRLSLGDMNTMAHAGVMVFRPRFRSILWRQMIEQGSSTTVSIRLQTLLMAVEEISKR